MDDFLGTVKMFAGDFAPVGWELCLGQLLKIQQYEALYSIIGTRYGGDGKNTFALPDFKGRSPAGVGEHTKHEDLKENREQHDFSHVGAYGGSELISFNPDRLLGDIPEINVKGTINIRVSDNDGDHTEATGAALGQQTGPIIPTSTKPFIYRAQPGISQNNYLNEKTVDFKLRTEMLSNPNKKWIDVPYMPPFTVINFIIAIKGIYPPKPFI